MQRRVLSIVTALTLSVGMFAAASPAMADEPPPGAAYVALGDSEAAGTGNLPYVDRECLRSKKAYPMLLAGWFGGVESHACSGADTGDLLAQAMAADLGMQTQLVTITAGVNNLDWQGVLAACSSAGSTAACAVASAAVPGDIATIPGGIVDALVVVRTRAPYALIAVTGYPMLFGAFSDSCSVGAFEGTPVKFTAEQAGAINFGLANVNLAIQAGVAAYVEAASDPGVRNVDVAAGFTGHGLCDTGDRWISGLVSGAPVFDRGFHANAAGQQAFASIIAEAIAP
jgi:lysophospholipase L1-like esterase